MSRTQPLDLLLSLMLALSHKVRTPLSVISNDLTFFKTLIDPVECERGVSKCRQISDYFKPAQLLSNSNAKSEVFNLVGLLREIFGDCLLSESYEMPCLGIKNNLQQALVWIAELLPLDKVIFLDEKCLLKFKILKSIYINENPQSVFKISSISEIYSAVAIDESIIPVLIDAILVSFSVECRILGENEFGLKFV